MMIKSSAVMFSSNTGASGHRGRKSDIPLRGYRCRASPACDNVVDWPGWPGIGPGSVAEDHMTLQPPEFSLPPVAELVSVRLSPSTAKSTPSLVTLRFLTFT